MRKINDRICLGLLIGLLANIPKTINDEFWYRMGYNKRRFSHVVAGIFLPYSKAKSRKGIIFGVYLETFISCLLGIPFVYMLTYTGKDKAWLKGLISGILYFDILRGILARVGIGKTYPNDLFTNAMMSVSSSLWGIAAGLLVPFLGNEELFKPKPRIQSNPPDLVEQ